MQRFLEQCAQYIYHTWPGNLPDICVVVPNRRAGVFFTSYLKKQLKQPVIGPRTTTINELMHSLSSLLPADQLKLLSHLYVSYREVTGSKESFDDFYFWGEILLADFDDIDKYLVDADDLFTNLSQVKEIESHFDYLTNEQKEYLGRFWGSLKNWEQFSHETDFVSFWGKLAEIYSRFRERLVNLGIGYSGLIMRDGVENGLEDKLASDFQKYIFIGLNALNKCEQRLFKQLKEEVKAIFLWDYDDFYLSGDLNPAGKFLRENLLRFPPPDDFHFESDNFRKEKDIELIAVASSTGQSQVIPDFMKNAGVVPESGYDNTAIVLADESLLFPVLGAIPEEIGTVNVTMGYPVKNSPVVSLLISLASMVRNSLAGNRQPGQIYYRWVTGILSHQLVKSFETPEVVARLKEIRTNNRIYLPQEELCFTDFHRLLFSIPENVPAYTPWFLEILGKIHEKTTDQSEYLIVRELIYSVYQELEKINAIVTETLQSGNIEISAPVYFRLVMQHLNRVSVPFAGEPLSGLQVMGILETRCLDFDNILIIGLNEDSWPRTSVAPSMVPFSLRKAFGLPGIDDQDAMYTYYFYRLIGRAKKVTATWSTVREATSGGELSRYGFQLLMNSPHIVKRLHHELAFQSNPVRPISIVSGSAVSRKLLEANSVRKPLSPSAFNMFLTCRLKFWFRYAAGLKEPDEVSEDIDRQAFGNIFHKSVEILYKPWVGKMVTAADMEGMSKRPGLIREAILRAFATEYFHKPESEWNKLTIEGKGLLIRSTLENYVKNLLEYDVKRSPFLLHSLEESYSAPVNVEIDGIARQISVGGKIDRIDEKGGVVSVIDYKTGSVAERDLVFGSVEELLDQDKKQLKKEVIQALIYSMVLDGSSFSGNEIKADIFSVLNLKDETFDGSIKLKAGNGEDVKAEFLGQVKKILAEIYSASTVFNQTTFTDRCKICPYNSICRK